MEINLEQPLLLTPLNAVPVKRTPWAGQRIAALLGKSNPALVAAQKQIGECWEFSCDPLYPTRILNTSIRLIDIIAKNPVAALSAKIVDKYGVHCQLLVKLINASRPLSFQVHPSAKDGVPEDGKWESWLVLDAASESGIYAGFSKPIDKKQLHKKITAKEDLRDLLGFVPIKPYSYFEIPPHTPHAISAGSIILEVQHLVTGKGGKTLRLWDWNCKYNAEGQLDNKNGQPRQLAVDPALKLISPQSQWGKKFLTSIKPAPQTYYEANGLEIKKYSQNPYYQVFSLHYTAASTFNLTIKQGYGIFISINGKIEISGQEIVGYQPIFIPAAASNAVKVKTLASFGQGVIIIPAISILEFR